MLDAQNGWNETLEPVPAWEAWRTLGMGRAALRTIGEVLIHPDETYSAMRRDGGLGGPLGFYLLVGMIVIVGNYLIGLPFDYALRQFDWSVLGEQGLQFQAALHEPISPVTQLLAVLIGGPIALLIGLFVNAGVLHILLMLLGGAHRDFEMTFRVVAYGLGACGLLKLIPVCGGLVFLVVSIVNLSIGLTRAHETDTWRAVLAVMLPMIALLTCCCGGVLLFGMAAGMSHYAL